jgi:uncharacterized membrane protein
MQPQAQDPDASPSGMAVASLILGIASWFALPMLGAVIGAVLGWIEMNRIERGESPAAGRTIAKIGFWLSIVNIVLGVLLSAAVVVLIVAGVLSLAALGL